MTPARTAAAAACLGALLASWAAGGLRAQETAAVALRVEPQTVLARIPEDFLGFGYETSAVARPGFFSAENAAMAQLYRTLTPHGIVRIGGNVSDHARYVADGAPAARPQEETTILNRACLDGLGEFLRATGWKAVWGLNLGTGPKEEAAAEAAAVADALGDRLHSFEIGNEVDFLPRFAKNFDAYHAAYSEYKTAVRAAVPGVAFSGPDVAADLTWCQRFAEAESGDFLWLTQHYYRSDARKPDATMETLLTPDTHWPRTLAGLREASRGRATAGYRICEVNSFSGGGKPGVSDTVGAALWCLDYLFTLAGEGCAGVNLETDVNQHGWVSHYSPIFREADGTLRARPEYYAMLAFSLAGTGEVVKLERTHGGPGINLAAHATRPDPGQLWVIVINKDPARDAAVEVTVPGGWPSPRTYALRGPGIGGTAGVTLAGSEVEADGRWTPAQPLPPLPAENNGDWRVSVPHASAMLLQWQR